MARRISLLVLVLLAAATLGRLPVTAQGNEPYNPVIDPANFVEGVDHPYFPLVPGTTSVYEGETDEGLEHIEVTVTDDTREVMGITCIVVRDTVWVDGELAEDTYDWFAQDVDGNVWYMGEDTTEYENGEPAGHGGAWEAGVDGALPGIVMQAAPEPGEPYRQEYYPGEAEDMAQVLRIDDSVTVAYGSFEGVVVTQEWNPLEPGVTELKYYVEGIGLVLEEVVEGETGRIELMDITTGDPDEKDDDAGENKEGDQDEDETGDEEEDGDDAN